MHSSERKRAFKKTWLCVQKRYVMGSIVSERGLQAALSEELRGKLPTSVCVVVEPPWTMADGTRKTPDLIIIEGEQITDIIELKFVPHHRAPWKKDIEKLRSYIRTPNTQYPILLDPKTGQWDKYFSVHDACRLHFVAVSRNDSDAVLPPLPLENQVSSINHWYERTGDGDDKWDIDFAYDQ